MTRPTPFLEDFAGGESRCREKFHFCKTALTYHANSIWLETENQKITSMKAIRKPLTPLTQRKAWKALATHCKKLQKLHLRKLFADDRKRGERLTAQAAGLFLDYSKNRITDETLKLLLALAKESGLRAAMDAMFRGEKINLTENRAVLHVALRAPKGASVTVD